MSETYQVRSAQLDDTEAISRLFRARITTWQRLDTYGQVHDLDYADLTIYERWSHGGNSGPWMSVETGAIWLNHLLLGNCIALVLEHRGIVAGYAEVYPGKEPKPYGKHLHIGHLIVLDDDSQLKRHLLEHIHAMTDAHIDRLTVAFSGYDSHAASFYTQAGFMQLARVERHSLRAQTGRNFYKATDHDDFDAQQITGWHMPVGHIQSSRQQWETMWPPLWQTIGEMQQRRTHKLHITASGQTALVLCQQHLYDARTAEIFCWSSMPLKAQLVIAICDWAHRQDYRSLVFAVTADTAKVLGAEYETQPYRQDIFGMDL